MQISVFCGNPNLNLQIGKSICSMNKNYIL